MIIATARDAADLLVPLFAGATGERVVVAHLDCEQRLIGTVEASDGDWEKVALPISAILREALRLSASGMIIAHNHPSGNSAPSAADMTATRELAATATSLGIKLYDHLIVGRDGECQSFRALGLL